MKFMVMPERKDIMIPPFKSAETNKEVDTGDVYKRQGCSTDPYAGAAANVRVLGFCLIGLSLIHI